MKIEPLLGELHRIADQVDENLPNAHRVALDPVRHVFGDQIDQFQAHGSAPLGKQIRDIGDGFRGSKSTSKSSSRPASIFEKSRMSLMMASSAWPERDRLATSLA